MCNPLQTPHKLHQYCTLCCHVFYQTCITMSYAPSTLPCYTPFFWDANLSIQKQDKLLHSTNMFKILNSKYYGIKTFPKPSHFGQETILCSWWDQKSIVYHELLKSGEIINTDHYHQQLENCIMLCLSKSHIIIKGHNNMLSHIAEMVQNYSEILKWEMLSHPANSPNLTPSYYLSIFIKGPHTLWPVL